MPEDDDFHEVRGAACEDEGPEQPEDRGEWNVPPPHHEVGDDAGNGKIRSPDGEVGENVQPAVRRGPIAAIPTGREALRVKNMGEEIQHGGGSFNWALRKLTIIRDVRSGVVRTLPTLSSGFTLYLGARNVAG